MSHENILEILFPYSMKNSAETCTFIFICIIIIISILYILIYSKCNRIYNKRINEYIKWTRDQENDISKIKFDDKIIKYNKDVKHVFDLFKNSLIQKDNKYFQAYDVEQFINRKNFAPNILKSRFFPWGASLLTSIGVTGTFLGLLLGISGLNLDGNMQELGQQISKIANGASTAFVTSIWGVVTSILITIFEKFSSNKTENKLKELQDSICKLFPYPSEIDTLNRVEINSNKIKDNSKDILLILNTVNKSSNESVEINNSIRDTLVESVEINNSIKDILTNIDETSSDTKDEMSYLAEQIGKEIQKTLPQIFEESLSKSIEEKLVPVINKMAEEFTHMSTNLKSGGESAINNAVGEFIEHIGIVGDRQKEQINGLISSMDTSSQTMNTICSSINGLCEKVNTLSNTTEVIINQSIDLQEQIHKDREVFSQASISIEKSTNALNNFSENIASSIEKASHITEEAKESIISTTNIYKNIHNEASIFIDKINEYINSIKTTINKTVENIQSVTEKQKITTTEAIDTMYSKLLIAVNNIDILANKIEVATQNNTTDISKMLKNFVTYCKELEEKTIKREEKYISNQNSMIENFKNIITQCENLQNIIHTDNDIFNQAALSMKNSSEYIDNASNNIKTFSSNIASSIKKASEITGEAKESIISTTYIYKHIQEKASTFIDKINEYINSIKTIVNGTVENIQSVTEKQKITTTEAIDTMYNKLIIAVNNIDNLANKIEIATQNNTTDISKMLKNFVIYCKELEEKTIKREEKNTLNQSNMIENFKNILTQCENLQNIIHTDNDIFNQAALSMKNSSEHIDNAANNIKIFSSNIENMTEKFSSSVNKVSDNINSVSDRYTILYNNVSNSIENIKNAINSFSTVSDSFKLATAEGAKQAIELKKNFEFFSKEMEQHRENLSQNQKKQLEELSNAIDDLLKQYTGLVQDEVSKMMGTWNESTVSFSNTIKETIEGIAEIVDNIDSNNIVN